MTIVRVVSVLGLKISFAVACSTLLVGLPSAAMAFGVGGPIVEDPKEPPKPSYGPGIPYISGRTGRPLAAPVDAPTGGVVPDDFCLPGKYEDCGDHLRDQPELYPQADGGPIFVGGETLAFQEAKQGVWFSGQYRTTDFNALSENRIERSYSIGADRRFGEKFVLGVMAVSSDITYDETATGIEDQATGILWGPYFAFNLAENWVLDGRYLSGNFEHSVLTGGVFTGSYQSVERFGAIRLSGTLDRNKWRLHPSIEVANLYQNKEAHIDGLRGPIAASITSDTFITASVLAYYKGFGVGNGTLTPYIGFEASSAIDRADNIFGTFRAGLSQTFGNGAILNIDYAYGAIGLAGIDDQQITVRLEIPF